MWPKLYHKIVQRKIFDLIEKYIEKDISPEQRHTIIGDLRLLLYYIIMQYQKIISSLDDISNQLSQFKTRNWVEMNNELRGTHNANYYNKLKLR